MVFPSKRLVVSRWTSPPCRICLLAKACHEGLEELLGFRHRRCNWRSLRLDERESNIDPKEIRPASKRPSTILVASSSNMLSSTGSRSG